MDLWLVIIIIVAVTTGGKVLTTAIEAFSGRPAPLPPPGDSRSGEDVRALRERVETLAEQVERLQEEQRFLTGLLEERPARRLEK